METLVRAILPSSKKLRWTGRVLSGLAAVFLLMDGAMKLGKPAVVVGSDPPDWDIQESDIVGIRHPAACLHRGVCCPPDIDCRRDLAHGGTSAEPLRGQVRVGNGWFNARYCR